MLSVQSQIDGWILDSGASFHCTPHHEMMQNYVAGDHGVVYLADGKPMDIVGIEDVQIKTTNGSIWNLQNVRHIPGLKKKLISVGQLDDSGHSIPFLEVCGRYQREQWFWLVERRPAPCIYNHKICRHYCLY